MNTSLMALAQAHALIRQGTPLVIGGTLSALRTCPTGRWIGGTTYYATVDQGISRELDDQHLLVTVLDQFQSVTVRAYDAEALPTLPAQAPDNGMSFVLVPFGSRCLSQYAASADTYPDLFLKPVVGWVSGVRLGAAGEEAQAYVVDGSTGEIYSTKAVALHVQVPTGYLADVAIFNPYSASPGSDELTFEITAQRIQRCLVNGERVALADYLAHKFQGHRNVSAPLVGDYNGAAVNVSIKEIHADGSVEFYAPVFSGVTYRFADGLADPAAYWAQVGRSLQDANCVFACNCVLNYLYGNLANTQVTSMPPNPATFGELAYQLLNQTFVVVRLLPAAA